VPVPSNPAAAPEADDATVIDLDAIERDLTDVQTALERLNDGSYWTDEITGELIAEDVLAAHPTARTATPTLG
jgi:RNA polymerase-binding transcription factor DksA